MKRAFVAARRRVLQQLALAGVAAGAPLSLAGDLDPRAEAALARALEALLPSRASAAALGEAYLRQFPAERSHVALAMRVLDQTSSAGVSLTAHGLHRLVQLDFERGQMVKVQGWLLSLTEARLCALCRLQDPGVLD